MRRVTVAARVHKATRDPRVRLAHWVTLVLPESQDPPAQRARLVKKASPEKWVRLARVAMMVQLEPRGPRALRAPTDLLASPDPLVMPECRAPWV